MESKQMSTWRLIHTPPARGAWNMAVDEALLEHAGRGESPPTLRLYAWEPPCLSLGHAQPFADVDLPGLEGNGWELVRRATGGRAILHTDELTYSVTGSGDDPALAGGVLESYHRLAEALLCALKELGLPVEVQERAHETAAHNVNPVCFEVPSTFEITAGGKKLIGSAQARRKEGVLQHGSLPLHGDLRRICEALTFKDEAARARAASRLLERAVTVEGVLGCKIEWEPAARAFVHGFEAALGIRLERGELSDSEMNRAEALTLEKYARPSWTERC
jgi:lipoate-protein ligase A